MSALRNYARALGGVVSGNQICFPGPGHSPKDRSCTLRLSPSAPDGFIVFAHAGEDFRTVRDYVRERIGITPSGRATRSIPRPRLVEHTATETDQGKIKRAQRLWREGLNPRGTLVETYLTSRRLDLPSEVADEVLRFHPACAWRDEDEAVIRVPAMLAVYRHIRSDAIIGVQATRLSPSGAKIDRRMRGSCGDGAIKFEADEHVTTGLTIGEGAETVMTGRQLGLRPAWALGSSGAIGKFPVLAGIQALTILAETGQTSARNVEQCAARWHSAGREVLVVDPRSGSDINDAWRELP